jgi:AraC-like DNA-binding protein
LQANEIIRAFTQLMTACLEKGLASNLFFDMKRQELFVLLFATYSIEELASFFYSLTGENIQFKEFVISNHIKAKNVKHLAQMANLSTSGFIKKFKRYFNESPYQWMLRHKAEIILREIYSSPTSFMEIAYKYNFSTYQHFVDFCKMQYGVSPSRLKNAKSTPMFP